MNGLPIRTSEVAKINESLLVGQRGPFFPPSLRSSML